MSNKTWKCWIDDWNGEDDPAEIQASEAEYAAEKYAEKYDMDGDAHQDCVTVFVEDEGKKREFLISMDWKRTFYSREIMKESEDKGNEVERG